MWVFSLNAQAEARAGQGTALRWKCSSRRYTSTARPEESSKRRWRECAPRPLLRRSLPARSPTMSKYACIPVHSSNMLCSMHCKRAVFRRFSAGGSYHIVDFRHQCMKIVRTRHPACSACSVAELHDGKQISWGEHLFDFLLLSEASILQPAKRVMNAVDPENGLRADVRVRSRREPVRSRKVTIACIVQESSIARLSKTPQSQGSNIWGRSITQWRW